VGLAASALLARYGVPSVVLERAQGLPDHPQVFNELIDRTIKSTIG
jgi:hypothetical protein